MCTQLAGKVGKTKAGKHINCLKHQLKLSGIILGKIMNNDQQ